MNTFGGPHYKTCPECYLRTKKHNEPTLSGGGFLDQIVVCPCGWCGVESVALTEREAKDFVASQKPKQLRMGI